MRPVVVTVVTPPAGVVPCAAGVPGASRAPRCP